MATTGNEHQRTLTSDTIRVVELLPADALTDPLHCESRIVPLDGHVPYEVVSFVWGKAKLTVQIEFDGKPAFVIPTIDSALRRMRHTSKRRTLWIDQLSIDQRNDEEKHIQVPLMREIYSKTNECLIWMGEFSADVDVNDAANAFEFLRCMATHDALPLALGSVEAMRNPMRALKTILRPQNQWWMRMWTLQESVLPRSASLLWGPLSIPWDTIERACANLHEGRLGDHPDKDVIFGHAGTLNNLSGQVRGLEFQRGRHEDGIATAFRWGFRQASDPLDMVYGFMGLFPRGSLRLSEEVDYELPLGKLYARFTVDLIRHDRSLRAIALFHNPASASWLPGWAHDVGDRWTLEVEIRDSDVGSFYLFENYGRFRASGEDVVPEVEYDDEMSTLSIMGTCIDTIRIVGGPLVPDRDGSKLASDESVVACIRSWHDIANDFYQSRGKKQKENPSAPAPWHRSLWKRLSHSNRDHPATTSTEARDPTSLCPQAFWKGLTNTDADLDCGREYMRTGHRISNGNIRNDVFTCMSLRTMFVTETGYLGFGPRHLESGDEVWILRGGNVPFIVRPRTGNPHRFIGSSYVDGIMHGEGVRGKSYDRRVTLT
ncbi:heterokaryon incompatibility protein-domain-containing protein [Xylariaceae sp. FL0016]|nr:heterokaryon incompatibility protein-domain-containing protein [Xylariaceae sp. FL0016]